MSRCTCCQVVLNQTELELKNEDGSWNDLCFTCIGVVNHPDYCIDHSYAFEEDTECPFPQEVKRPKKLSDSY